MRKVFDSGSARPSLRIRARNLQPPREDGRFVLYWMIGARRPSWNAGLDRARAWSAHLSRPLLVLEALRTGHRWSSDRIHRFVIDGMRDNQQAFAARGVTYYPYVEPEPGHGRGLIARLAEEAAVVITDRTPAFDLPSLVTAAERSIHVRFEDADSCGLLPLDAATRGQVFPTAYAFRRFLQRSLRPWLEELSARNDSEWMPWDAAATGAVVPDDVRRNWPEAPADLLDGSSSLARFAIDHAVAPVGGRGGWRAAQSHLGRFLDVKLTRYDDRSHPDEDLGSGLSPYLHFGHVSTDEVVHRLLGHEGWTPDRLGTGAAGKKEGWWGLSAQAEGFLDELVTWRELGYNMSDRRPDCDRFESLPPWAIRTLEQHAPDRREHAYSLDEFAAGATHDPLWNAAQRQLVMEGRIQGYLRMLWGKKILEWTPAPRAALEVMIELNNRFAIDGRDPNSISGIFWVLGRYDRPWAPERPVFGSVRFMSSANTARKLRVREYLRRYSA